MNPDEQVTPDDSYTLAASMAARWLAAHHAQEPQAADMMNALLAEPRGFALVFGALADLFLNTLSKLDRDGALQDGAQVWLDRLALNAGAAADEVVARHRGDPDDYRRDTPRGD